MIHVLKRNLASEILDSIDYLKTQKQVMRSPQISRISISLEIPKNRANGDLSSNIALRKSRDANLDALNLANLIVETLKFHLDRDHKLRTSLG